MDIVRLEFRYVYLYGYNIFGVQISPVDTVWLEFRYCISMDTV
jgi:hypothetical protein